MDNNQKLTQYDVDGSLYAMMRAAKVEILDFKEEFYELIQKQDNLTTNVDKLKYPACEVTAVFVIRNNQKERFYQGADFDLDLNGSIVWKGSHIPNDREIYTIYYKYSLFFQKVS